MRTGQRGSERGEESDKILGIDEPGRPGHQR